MYTCNVIRSETRMMCVSG